MSAAGGESSRGATTIDEEVDYYQVLDVPYHATTAEIRRAYRAAMKQTHPDRQSPGRRPKAEERAKLLNRAFTTLTKPQLRQAYDRKIRAQVVQDQIMGRYVGGFVTHDVAASDPYATRLRRQPTTAERQERARSERDAILSVVLVFVAITVAVVGVLLVWAALDAVIEAAV